MKGATAVQEAILTVGMVVISVTLLATQVPAMVDQIQEALSDESVKEKANELANQLSSISSSNEAKLTYSFPSGKSYDVYIKDGYANVTSGSDSAKAKTLVQIEFVKRDVKTLTITKDVTGVIRIE